MVLAGAGALFNKLESPGMNIIPGCLAASVRSSRTFDVDGL